MASSQTSSSEPFQTIMAKERPGGVPRWLIAGGIGLLLVGGGFLVWRLMGARGRGPMGGMPPGVSVVVEPVQAGTVRETSEFLGSLESESGVTLQPEVSGRIIEVRAVEGQRVERGEPIALISPDRSQAEVNAARASVSSAQANVSVARAAEASSAATLRSLLAREAELVAELDLSQKDFDRSVELEGEGAISTQALDTARRDLEASKALLQSAREEIAASQASLEQAQASFDQAEASLSEAEANQAVAQENLQDRTVVAPIAGIVGDVEVKLGNYVTPSTVITNIMENTVLELDIEVPVDERNRLNLGLPVELVAAGEEEAIADGSITFISPQTNADTQTVLVKAQFDNPQQSLQDSQRIEARIVWSEDTGVLVPTSAVTRLGGQTFVFVTEEGTPEELPPPEAIPPDMPAPTQVARLRPVELGAIQDNSYQILSGLERGEEIVVSGILNLRDGTPILPQSEEEAAEDAAGASPQ